MNLEPVPNASLRAFKTVSQVTRGAYPPKLCSLIMQDQLYATCALVYPLPCVVYLTYRAVLGLRDLFNKSISRFIIIRSSQFNQFVTSAQKASFFTVTPACFGSSPAQTGISLTQPELPLRLIPPRRLLRRRHFCAARCTRYWRPTDVKTIQILQPSPDVARLPSCSV